MGDDANTNCCADVRKVVLKCFAVNDNGAGGDLNNEDVLTMYNFFDKYDSRKCMCFIADTDEFRVCLNTLFKCAITIISNDQLWNAGVPAHSEAEQSDVPEPESDTPLTLEQLDALTMFVNRLFNDGNALYMAKNLPVCYPNDPHTQAYRYMMQRVCESRLLNVLHDKLHGCTVRNLLPRHAQNLIALACTIRNGLSLVGSMNTKEYKDLATRISRLVTETLQYAVDYLCECVTTSEEVARTAAYRICCDHIWKWSLDDTEDNSQPEPSGIRLAVNHLESTNLTLKINAINQITEYIRTCASDAVNNYPSSQQSVDNETNDEWFAQELSTVLLRENVMGRVFGASAHAQVLKQSQTLLEFFCRRECLSEAHLRAIWAVSQRKDCSRCCYELLIHIARILSIDLLLQLDTLLQSVAVNEHTDASLLLVYTVCDQILFLGLHRSRFLNVSNSDEADSDEEHEPRDVVKPVNATIDLCSSGDTADASTSQPHVMEPSSSLLNAQLSPSQIADESGLTEAEGIIDQSQVSTDESSLLEHNDSVVTDESSELSPTTLGAGNQDADSRKRQLPPVLSEESVDRMIVQLELPNKLKRARTEDDEPERPTVARLPDWKQQQQKMLPGCGGIMAGDGRVPVWVQRKCKDDSSMALSAGSSDEGSSLSDGGDVEDLSALLDERDQLVDEDESVEQCFEREQLAQMDWSLVTGDKEARTRALQMNVGGITTGRPIYASKCSTPVEGITHAQWSLVRLAHGLKQHVDGVPGKPMAHSSVTSSDAHMLTTKVCTQQHVKAIKGECPFPHITAGTLSSLRSSQVLLWQLLVSEPETLGAHELRLAQEYMYRLIRDYESFALSLAYMKRCIRHLSGDSTCTACIMFLNDLIKSATHANRRRMSIANSRADIAVDVIPASLVEELNDQYALRDVLCHNLERYYHNRAGGANQTRPHTEELEWRLLLLHRIFSSPVSSETFSLTCGQLNLIWTLMFNDIPEGRSMLCRWLLEQLNGEDKHAISAQLEEYIVQHKLDEVDASSVCSTELQLVQVLATRVSKPALADECAQLLWRMALSNHDVTVSRNAMTCVSAYYLNAKDAAETLCKERTFIRVCMRSLATSVSLVQTALDTTPISSDQLDAVLAHIHRAVNILRMHADEYRTRHNFMVRLYEMVSVRIRPHLYQSLAHLQLASPCFQIYIQLSSASKHVMIVPQSETLGELRCRIAHLYLKLRRDLTQATARLSRNLVGQQNNAASTISKAEASDGESTSAGSRLGKETSTTDTEDADAIGGMSDELSADEANIEDNSHDAASSQQSIVSDAGEIVAPASSNWTDSTSSDSVQPDLLSGMLEMNQKKTMRICIGVRELTPNMDMRPIALLGVNNATILHVSMQANRGGADELPCIPHDTHSPTAILNDISHWSQLMRVVSVLQSLAIKESSDRRNRCVSFANRAYTVISTCVPTNHDRLEYVHNMFQDSTSDNGLAAIKQLLDPSRAEHELLYDMQVLGIVLIPHRRSIFIESNGFPVLLDVFMKKCRQLMDAAPESDDALWQQWRIDVVTHALRLLYWGSISDSDLASLSTQAKLQDGRLSVLPPLVYGADAIVPMVDVSCFGDGAAACIDVLLELLEYVCSTSADNEQVQNVVLPGNWHTSRIQCMRYAWFVLNSLLMSDVEGLQPVFCRLERIRPTLKVLLIDCVEHLIRQETFSGLVQLCLCKTNQGTNASQCAMHVFTCMIALLNDAGKIPPPPPQQDLDNSRKTLEQKDTNSASASAYFILLHNLLERITDDQIKSESTQSNLTDALVSCIDLLESRPVYETSSAHSGSAEDACECDLTLKGLIMFCRCLVKFVVGWKETADCKKLMQVVCNFLFCLPSHTDKKAPKCKSSDTRQAAYDLLAECVKDSDQNFNWLYPVLLKQHQANDQNGRPALESPIERTEGLLNSSCKYTWEYWPHDEKRSVCGFVGLVNLGATCYMATSIQHLFMLPELRRAVLGIDMNAITKHRSELVQLQKLFAFLQESERRAYEPREFCASYQMDGQQLNSSEQKDMTEFLNDLMTKMEEASPVLKTCVKKAFCGVMSNNVVSEDCEHVSRTTEEFYTVRCQVADVKDLGASLEEQTAADILDGDNMYTCDKCNKKVKAKKLACFKQLPDILSFNTMRYSFNMVTMLKEKVNTFFSFPTLLDMWPYLEQNLLPDHVEASESPVQESECKYELCGVTVHTGNAEGGHYYSFIRHYECADQWLCFNDADVCVWDPSNMAHECFGGENDLKLRQNIGFLDMSFEKANSAYMLFYKRISINTQSTSGTQLKSPSSNACSPPPSLQSQLEKWIWDDNRRFVGDLLLFDHQYTTFIRQFCSQLAQTLTRSDAKAITLKVTKLSLRFVLETMIHSKEKPTITEWMELVLKNFQSCPEASEWLLNEMIECAKWPLDILIRCPNMLNRQLFKELVSFPMNQFIERDKARFCLPWTDGLDPNTVEPDQIGQQCCSTRFVQVLLALLADNQLDVSLRQLAEFFQLLLKFAECDEVKQFMLLSGTIARLVAFYMRHVSVDTSDQLTDNSDDEDDELSLLAGVSRRPMTSYNCQMQRAVWVAPALVGLQELITLLLRYASVNGNSKYLRKNDLRVMMCQQNVMCTTSGDEDESERMVCISFALQHIRDSANFQKAAALIVALINVATPASTNSVLNELFQKIISCNRESLSKPYFNVLSHLVVMESEQERIILNWEASNATSSTADRSSGSSSPTQPNDDHPRLRSPPGERPLPLITADLNGPLSTKILAKVWQATEQTHRADWWLNWLEQISDVSIIRQYLFERLDTWVNKFLLKASSHGVRAACAKLVLSLVPCASLRQQFNSMMSPLTMTGNRNALMPRQTPVTPQCLHVLHQIYNHLLCLLPKSVVRQSSQLPTNRLVPYLFALRVCLVTNEEKAMLVSTPEYAQAWWTLFDSAQRQIKFDPNKQALLLVLYSAAHDCPLVVDTLVAAAGPNLPKFFDNFMSSYVVIDQRDRDLCAYNKQTLHAYYGLMRLFMAHARCMQVAVRHHNLHWAIDSVMPGQILYKAAVDELIGVCDVICHSSTLPQADVKWFREQFWKKLRDLAARSRANYTSVITSLKFLGDTPDDKLYLLNHGVLNILSDVLQTVHNMLHDATACNVTGDLTQVLKRLHDFLQRIVQCAQSDSLKERACAMIQEWSEKGMSTTTVKHLLTLLNSWVSPELRTLVFSCLRDVCNVLAQVQPNAQLLLCVLLQLHAFHAEVHARPLTVAVGPYFPRRTEQRVTDRAVHPPRPAVLNMSLMPLLLEAHKGVDEEYDQRLHDYFGPYHSLVDMYIRLFVNMLHEEQDEADTSKDMDDTSTTSESASSVDRRSLHKNVVKVVDLCVMCAVEGAPMHLSLFAKLWLDLHNRQQSKQVDSLGSLLDSLFSSRRVHAYLTVVLTTDYVSLNNGNIHRFILMLVNNLSPCACDANELRGCCENLAHIISTQAANKQNTDWTINKSIHVVMGLCRSVMIVCSEQFSRLISQSATPPGRPQVPVTSIQPFFQLMATNLAEIQQVINNLKEATNCGDSPAEGDAENTDLTECSSLIEQALTALNHQ